MTKYTSTFLESFIVMREVLFTSLLLLLQIGTESKTLLKNREVSVIYCWLCARHPYSIYGGLEPVAMEVTSRLTVVLCLPITYKCMPV